MNIGIDIDDTIVVTTKQILKYADIYNKEKFGKDELKETVGKIKDRFYISSIYGWDEKVKYQFFERYYKKILEECTFLDGAVEILQKLKSENNNLYFITARNTNIKDCDTINITKNMLEKYNIEYDKIIFDAYDKLHFAKEYNIDVFIDDIFYICNVLQENNIKSFLMTSKMNSEIDTKNIERVNTWNEVYDRINEYKRRYEK